MYGTACQSDFLFAVAHPFCMHFSAIRNIIARIRKSLNRSCFKHYGKGNDLADAGYGLKIAVRLLHFDLIFYGFFYLLDPAGQEVYAFLAYTSGKGKVFIILQERSHMI